MKKQPLRSTIGALSWMLASSTVIAPTPGAAAPSYSGTITGSFDSPVRSGYFLQPGTRLRVSQDNTSTTVGSGIGTSSVAWGDDSGGTLPPSTLTFTGNSFSNAASGQVFPLGTLTYFNGPNSPSSLIFGVTMHLSAGDGIMPFTGPVAIVSTQNGTIDRVTDADLLFFSNFEVPSTLGAFEGTAVTAVIFGRIVGESQLEIASIALAEGQAHLWPGRRGDRGDARAGSGVTAGRAACPTRPARVQPALALGHSPAMRGVSRARSIQGGGV